MADMINEDTPLIQSTDHDKLHERRRSTVPSLCSKRYILAYVGFLCFLCVFSIRANMSVAIVCMTNQTSVNWTKINNSTSEVYSSSNGEFNWNKQEQSVILGAYFYGSVVTQIPGGWLAGRYGGKRVIGGGMLLGSVACLLIPLGSRIHIAVVDVLRVIQGLAAGVMFPAFHSLWGKWSPPLEASQLTTICYIGCYVGIILTFAVSGVLCDYGFDGGWPSIFYITGGMAFLFTVMWFPVVAESPAEHPSISAEERSFIINSIGNRTDTVGPVPWLQLLKSKAVWACVVANFCCDWVNYTFLTSMPTFMKEAWDYDIETNGGLSALPAISPAFVGLSGAFLADCLRSRTGISTKAIRRIIQVTAFAGTAGCLAGVGFITKENRIVGVVLLVIGVGVLGLSEAGYHVNHIDFAPQYAGVTMGITNSFGAASGFLAPLAVGFLTPDKTQEEWRNMFYLSAGLCILGATVFGAFAKGEREPWAQEKKR